MNPDAAPTTPPDGPRGRDLLREMGGPAWRPFDAIDAAPRFTRFRIAWVFVRMIIRQPLLVVRSAYLRSALLIAFYEVLFVVNYDADDGMSDVPDDLRVLVKVGRMIVARDWALVKPGEEYKLDDDSEWRVKGEKRRTPDKRQGCSQH